MAKDIATSRIRLFERIRAVLVSQFATQLAAIGDGGLSLDGPESDGYLLSKDGGGIEEYRVNHHVAVSIFASGARVLEGLAAGDGVQVMARSHLPVSVEVHARFAPQSEHTELGKGLPLEELELWRAERYLGALVKTIYKHVRTADDCYNVRLASDSTRLESGWAVARADFVASQEVLIPTPDYSTV